MPSLKEQFQIIDEAYLVGISNRGLTGRAQKDLATAGIKVTLSDSVLEAIFADGTQVTIQDTLHNFACTCPSRSICKHVLMAMMKARESTGDALEPTAPEGGFDYLLAFTPELLIKEYGKPAFNDAVFKMSAGSTGEIEEGSILSIQLMQGTFTVRFLPGATLEESVCTCKGKACRHRLEAILQYIRYKTGTFHFEPVLQEGEVNTGILPQVLLFIEDILRTGLIRLPDAYAEKCTQFATLCHGAGFARFERLLEVCGRELTSYAQKSADFNLTRLLRNLSRIYQMGCAALASEEAAIDIAGKFKRQYMELPKIRVLGLGAYPWSAKSGFCGVTAVFWCPDIERMVTFTSSRPTESKSGVVKTIQQMWRSKSAWSLPISFSALAQSELSLLGAKTSDDGRLSSSESTSGSLLQPQTSLAAEGLEKAVFDDFSQLKHLFSLDPDSDRMAYAVLKISSLQDGRFDKVSQTYTAQVTDHSGNILPLSIRYSKINETAILNFEHLVQSEIIPDAITVSILIADDRYEAAVFPIAVWLDGMIKNIGEEKLFAEETKSKFSKFFEGLTI